jgi:hypothetical protein
MQDRRTRALGYVPTRRGDGGRFRAEVAALERGCTTLGLTLVGVVTEEGPADVPEDVDYVVVTEYDRAEGMEEVLAGRVRLSAPLVVLASTAAAAMAARQGGRNA